MLLNDGAMDISSADNCGVFNGSLMIARSPFEAEVAKWKFWKS
jgi:hypothetical protein